MRQRDMWKWYWNADTATPDLLAPERAGAVTYDLRSGSFLFSGATALHIACNFVRCGPPDEKSDRTMERIVARAWDYVRSRSDAGDPVPAEAVAELVRHWPIPDDLRALIAGMLTGDVKQKCGKKPAGREDRIRRAVTVHRVMRWKRVFDRIRQRTGRSSDPYREALMKVSEETGTPEATLDKWCYPRHRSRPT